MLQDVPGIGDVLDKLNFEGDTNDTLQNILAHRASHLGAKVGFWNSAYGDLPRQLIEDANVGFSYIDTNGEQHVPSLDPQMFSRHPVYRDAVLVRNLFRCFHRGDGSTPSCTINSEACVANNDRIPPHHEPSNGNKLP